MVGENLTKIVKYQSRIVTSKPALNIVFTLMKCNISPDIVLDNSNVKYKTLEWFCFKLMQKNLLPTLNTALDDVLIC